MSKDTNMRIQNRLADIEKRLAKIHNKLEMNADNSKQALNAVALFGDRLNGLEDSINKANKHILEQKIVALLEKNQPLTGKSEYTYVDIAKILQDEGFEVTNIIVRRIAKEYCLEGTRSRKKSINK